MHFTMRHMVGDSVLHHELCSTKRIIIIIIIKTTNYVIKKYESVFALKIKSNEPRRDQGLLRKIAVSLGPVSSYIFI